MVSDHPIVSKRHWLRGRVDAAQPIVDPAKLPPKNLTGAASSLGPSLGYQISTNALRPSTDNNDALWPGLRANCGTRFSAGVADWRDVHDC